VKQNCGKRSFLVDSEERKRWQSKHKTPPRKTQITLNRASRRSAFEGGTPGGTHFSRLKRRKKRKIGSRKSRRAAKLPNSGRKKPGDLGEKSRQGQRSNRSNLLTQIYELWEGENSHVWARKELVCQTRETIECNFRRSKLVGELCNNLDAGRIASSKRDPPVERGKLREIP